MKNAICTIVTSDYQHYAMGLFDSLLDSGFHDFHFIVFVSCNKQDCQVLSQNPNVSFVFVDDLCACDLGKEIYDAYYLTDMDKFRWSMKSVLILHLISTRQFEKVMCVDCDINFYTSPKFLFELLDEHTVLLTPHYRESLARNDRFNFLLMFTQGLYNAGFFAVSAKGIEVVQWWGLNCLEVCEKNDSIGQFVDQTHLNLIPIYFNDVHILKHRGCNVAGWNLSECRRTINEAGEVKINDEFDVVFIHFTGNTVKNIRFGNDRLLEPHLVKYIERLQKYKPNFVHPAIQEYMNRKKIVKRKPTVSQRIVNRLKRLFEK